MFIIVSFFLTNPHISIKYFENEFYNEYVSIENKAPTALYNVFFDDFII